MLSLDFEKLGILYESVVQESPDNITVDGTYYDYDQSGLNNYTGILNTDGKFVMSTDIVGHGNLIYDLKSDDIDIKNLVTNFDSIDAIKSSGIMNYNNIVKFRIWPKFKVFSMWDRYTPAYKPAIDASILAIGSDPTEYNFDPPDGSGRSENFMSYSDYVVDELSDAEKESKLEQERRMEADRLALGKLMASRNW